MPMQLSGQRLKVSITKGTSFNTFSPNSTCTRAQIVTFIYRALGK